jgi:putative (di)nucleoside polyphosphate hydrolase
MIDENGFRLNAGIILSNAKGELFWGRRLGKKEIWQFPQGGIHPNETPIEAMYRELYEEVGLRKEEVAMLAQTQQWFCYYVPKHLQRRHQKPLCIGQKQKWFLLRLLADEKAICFNRTNHPEFSTWRWVDYWYPLKQVISFKQGVYRSALEALAPFR